jgi:hypothetical protein
MKQHLQPPVRLAIDLILPLLHQRHRTDNERRLALDLLAVGRVGENQAKCLNRLSESHVVREDTTTVLLRLAVFEPVETLDLMREKGNVETVGNGLSVGKMSVRSKEARGRKNAPRWYPHPPCQALS